MVSAPGESLHTHRLLKGKYPSCAPEHARGLEPRISVIFAPLEGLWRLFGNMRRCRPACPRCVLSICHIELSIPLITIRDQLQLADTRCNCSRLILVDTEQCPLCWALLVEVGLITVVYLARVLLSHVPRHRSWVRCGSCRDETEASAHSGESPLRMRCRQTTHAFPKRSRP